jgi:hypothetical protein
MQHQVIELAGALTRRNPMHYRSAARGRPTAFCKLGLIRSRAGLTCNRSRPFSKTLVFESDSGDANFFNFCNARHLFFGNVTYSHFRTPCSDTEL